MERYVRAIRQNAEKYKLEVCWTVTNQTQGNNHYVITANKILLYRLTNAMTYQVLVLKNLLPQETMMSVVKKVVLLLNAKLRGELWSVHFRIDAKVFSRVMWEENRLND